MWEHRLRGVVDTIPERQTVLASSCGGFVACPLLVGHHGMMTQALVWQQLYALALEQARAVAQPSRLERLQKVLAN